MLFIAPFISSSSLNTFIDRVSPGREGKTDPAETAKVGLELTSSSSILFMTLRHVC